MPVENVKLATEESQFDLAFDFTNHKYCEELRENINLQCFLQSYTSKECVVCHPKLIEMLEMYPLNQWKVAHLEYEWLLEQNLSRKYMTSMDYYNLKVTNDIIYNEASHTVACFKDYLIYDDLSEFLKRSYNS